MQHRAANVVYVPTLKAASTYFQTHLAANGFIRVDFEQIDLTSSNLFSHIIDPIQRRNKGVAEFFNYAIDLPNELLLTGAQTHNQLLQILQAPYFDSHSAPLHLLYEGYIERIHFIPIDVQEIDYLQVTSDFLRLHGLEIHFPQEKIHQSDQSKTEIFHLVQAHLKSSTRYSDLFRSTFSKDIALYQNCIHRFLDKKTSGNI